MSDENMNIIAMEPEYASAISRWKYDGIYVFYNHSAENISGYLDGTHYACLDGQGELIGYFCFGDDARIPTVESGIYDGESLDIGLGLRPDLCGKNYGLSFLDCGLRYALKTFQAKRLRLSVAAFNERAIKVYIKAGFLKEREVINSYYKNKFFIMTKSY